MSGKANVDHRSEPEPGTVPARDAQSRCVTCGKMLGFIETSVRPTRGYWVHVTSVRPRPGQIGGNR